MRISIMFVLVISFSVYSSKIWDLGFLISDLRYSVNLIKIDKTQRYNKSAILNPKLLLNVGIAE